MTLDLIFMSADQQESPPPYSAVVATAESDSVDSFDAGLPFSHSGRLAAKVRALVSEGNALYARFQDVRDVASAGAKFEYQEPALVLSQRFEKLIWESRSTAGIALAALKDFNEIILDFLSEPDATVQDRLRELTNPSKMLQRERNSAADRQSSFDALVKQSEDFHQMIYSESGPLIPKRRRQSHSRGRGTKGRGPARNVKPPFVVPSSEPLNCLSTVTVSLGTISRTCMDYALHFERIAENAVFPSWVCPPLEAQATHPTAPNPNPNPPAERKRLCALRPIINEHAELAALPGFVNTLVHELRAFTHRVDIFNTIFAELARAQNIFVVYLKDGQSVADQGYRSEINRLRRQLPCVCNALDAYSKARLT